jgi:hypothetical protein
LFASFDDNAWYVNFGTSMHLFHKREWFKNFEEIPLTKIYLRNNLIQEVIGKGKVMVILKIGKTKINVFFNDVLYVPRLT